MQVKVVFLLCLIVTALVLTGVHQVGASGRRVRRSSVAQCGRPVVQPSAHRVVGGQEAQRGAWPWTVGLMDNGFLACAGAIISDRVILTAAHCFEEVITRNASRWNVTAGKHNFFKTERGQMTFKVEKIVLHEHYIRPTVENDIALMVTSDTIPFTNFIRPICVPQQPSHDSSSPLHSSAALPAGTPCMLAGWGEMKGTGPRGVLMEVLLPVISDAVCGLPNWYNHHFIPQKTFCAGYEEGRKDACVGDSGGPLISNSDDQRWYVNGITSWGYGCAEPRWPGVYTNVSYYLPWIQAQLTTIGLPLPGLSDEPIIG